MTASTSGMVIHVDGFALHRESATADFLIRDIDLAEGLGYDRPRDIRKLIRSLAETGELAGVQSRATVARQPVGPGGLGTREFEVTEYWLDRIEALLVVMRSDAPKAIPMRRVIADVFYKALLQYEESRTALRSWPEHMAQWLLSSQATEFEKLWPDSLIRELERLHHREWAGGRHPFHMKSTYPPIYRTIMSSDLAEKMFANNPDKDRIRHHQFVTPEARPFIIAQLGIVEAIARCSRDKDDFWARLERQYKGGLLQLDLVRGAR